MQLRRAVTFAILLTLAGCGEEAVQAPSTAVPTPPTPTAPQLPLRIADFKRADGPARCEAGEEILNAFCFADPDRSISASGPVFLPQPDGTFSVDCMTGGGNIRLFCLKR